MSIEIFSTHDKRNEALSYLQVLTISLEFVREMTDLASQGRQLPHDFVFEMSRFRGFERLRLFQKCEVVSDRQADSIQRVFENNMGVGLRNLEPLWHQLGENSRFESFERLIRACITLPVGYTMLRIHRMHNNSNDMKMEYQWQRNDALWTTQLVSADEMPTYDSDRGSYMAPGRSHYVITACRCIPGIIDIALLSADEFVGFKTLLSHLCDAVDDPSKDDNAILERCRRVLSTHRWQDIDYTPASLITEYFAGWRISNSGSGPERCVMLTQSVRSSDALNWCEIRRPLNSSASGLTKRAPYETRMRAVHMHLLRPLSIANDIVYQLQTKLERTTEGIMTSIKDLGDEVIRHFEEHFQSFFR